MRSPRRICVHIFPPDVHTDQAKWVNSAVSSDNECETTACAAGSSVAEVTGGVAQFAFEGDIQVWNLCYKHGSEDWLLYGSMNPTATLSASATETTSETQLTKATVSLTLEGSISSYPSGSTTRAEFETAFLSDLANALGEDISRFQIEDIRAGSVVVDFSISPTG